MKKSIKDAQIPNPALEPLHKLAGNWKTSGTHPLLPDTPITGHSSFKWLEGGAFLAWYSEMDDENFPAGITIFGSDDATNELFMLYFDSRKVSRRYQVSVQGNVIKWWRDAPGFNQRYTWTFADVNTIEGRGELCRDGSTWERDLEQIFVRMS